VTIAPGNRELSQKFLWLDKQRKENEMKRVMIVMLMVLWGVGVAVESQAKDEPCFGAIGNGCAGGGGGPADWVAPPAKDIGGGMKSQAVSVGSILHDNCCVDNANGQHCNGYDLGQEKMSDSQPCVKEWRKAVYNSRDGRKWTATFGPYNDKVKSDDLTKAIARKAVLTDHWNTKKYDYTGQETVSTRKLGAPRGASLDYADVAFCASGKFQSYNDPLQLFKGTTKHYSPGVGDWGVCE
jgi:hypothetical protein